MRNELADLMKVVERMSPEMAREVLNFALHLQRKQAQAANGDAVEEGDSHYGTSGDGFDLLDRWDAIESPMNKRDLA